LGNQLYQYAFAMSLAEAFNCEFMLDVSGFADQNLREYMLTKFNLC